MCKGEKKRKNLFGVLAVLLALLVGAGIMPLPVTAASGNVYTCTINRAYAHPITGVVEDSGGKEQFTTGQGMVEGTIAGMGLMEATDDGQYFLTINMSLIDYVSDINFSVQNYGESGWQSAPMGVTGKGKNSMGNADDICIQVPSENCIVRGTMFVVPMGRTVIYYLYPSEYQQGNSVGMNATMVTEASTGGASVSEATMTTAAGPMQPGAAMSPGGVKPGGGGGTPMPGPAGAVKPGGGKGDLNSSAGLSLSTAKGKKAGSVADSGSGMLNLAIVLLLVGLLLIGVATMVVYYFRKNWYRFGAYDDDDE